MLPLLEESLEVESLLDESLFIMSLPLEMSPDILACCLVG